MSAEAARAITSDHERVQIVALLFSFDISARFRDHASEFDNDRFGLCSGRSLSIRLAYSLQNGVEERQKKPTIAMITRFGFRFRENKESLSAYNKCRYPRLLRNVAEP